MAARPGTPVLGADERVEALTRLLKDGEAFELGSLRVRVLHTPCHTTGSCCYHVHDPATGEHAVFTGDTVFTGVPTRWSHAVVHSLLMQLAHVCPLRRAAAAGCGRFFEGSAQQMLANMDRLLAQLPAQTLMYPGHEYTVSNLQVRVDTGGLAEPPRR